MEAKKATSIQIESANRLTKSKTGCWKLFSTGVFPGRLIREGKTFFGHPKP
jgi:hypothetical protein